MITTITAVVAAGNFDTAEDAAAYAAAIETVARDLYPDASISVDLRPHQTGGAFVRVEIDGDDDEVAATYIADRAAIQAS